VSPYFFVKCPLACPNRQYNKGCRHKCNDSVPITPRSFNLPHDARYIRRLSWGSKTSKNGRFCSIPIAFTFAHFCPQSLKVLPATKIIFCYAMLWTSHADDTPHGRHHGRIFVSCDYLPAACGRSVDNASYDVVALLLPVGLKRDRGSLFVLIREPLPQISICVGLALCDGLRR